MSIVPIVIGVTPCCNMIMRTSTTAINRAYQSLSEGVCPDCLLELHKPSFAKTISQEDRKAIAWFLDNAHMNDKGHYCWNSYDASTAYIEIHEGG